jgi:hypothetical protein
MTPEEALWVNQLVGIMHHSIKTILEKMLKLSPDQRLSFLKVIQEDRDRVTAFVNAHINS